ncbi:unnamed protein product [Discula destructiva]
MAASANESDGTHIRPWLVGAVSALVGLSLISVALRLISRQHLMRQRLWGDDHMIISSATCNLVSAGLIFAMHSQGLGLPTASVTPAQEVVMAKLSLASGIVYTWNLCLTKLAILLMYYRIFDVSRAAKAALVALGAFVVVWSCLSSFLFIFTCAPVQKLWIPDTPGHCIDQVGRWIANAASTIFTDLAIIILPIPQLLRLTLSRTEKFWVTLLVAQGLFVVIASTYRFALLFSYTATNASYTMARVAGWSEIEIAAGIVAANLPILKPLTDRLLLSFCGVKEQTTFLSGGSTWRSGWHTGSGGKKLSGDNAQSLFKTRGSDGGVCSVADMWDWSRCIESNTRPVELAKNQYRATASRGRDSDTIEVPMHGISVTKDFRRWSVVDRTTY